ncbi:MAG: restriction endonuclease subunit S [Oscillospiraceae bacterium]
MALTKYKLGELISLCDDRNSELKYTVRDVKGISIQKVFIETKADMSGVSLKPYILVKPDYFAYVTVTSRNGEKITIAHNDTNSTYIVSSSYVVFKVKRADLLDSDYLFMYFNRPEFDRYSRFNSWGSARETFSWEEMCDIDISLPPLSVQQKYVSVYQSMLANQQSYEQGLEDLKLVCDAYIEDLRRKMPCEALAPYITPIDERNSNLEIKLAQGITIDKKFADPKQVASAEKNAKIVRKGQFAYNRATTRNGEKISIAYRTGEDCVVSSAYQVFEISVKDKLLPEYLMMWFKRSEFDRYARYMSKGSAHEFFEYADMEEVKIPIPNIEIQQDIVNIYQAYIMRKEINEQMKDKIKNICPILIKGSLEEGENGEITEF